MKHITIAALLLVSSCFQASSDTMTRVLEAEGFTDYESTGLAPLSCSKGDTFRSGFRAKGRNSKPVTGAVCCGIFKSCTVRID